MGQKAEKASKLPSECLPGLADEIGEWGVYCFDNAVGYFMRVIQNALLERENNGTEADPKWGEARYTLEELLDPHFRLPRPPTAKQRRQQTGLNAMVAAFPGMVSRFKQAPKVM